MVESRIFQLALKLIEGLGDKGIKHLLQVFGSTDEIFKASKKDLQKIGKIRSTCINPILRKSTLSLAEQWLNELENQQINFCFYSDPQFPTRLLDIPDGPTLFYYQGNNNFNPNKTVAIVGSRNNTDYGQFVVEDFISKLQKYDCTIVSGLAYGIDIKAHKEAVRNGLDTWAVIGGGHNHIYPSTHKKYLKEIKVSGAIISEYLPDTKPIMAYFPARNRIIAGLSDAIIRLAKLLKNLM